MRRIIFDFTRGVQGTNRANAVGAASRVTTREYGVIPGCVAAKDFEPGIPIQQVLECADERAEQYSRACSTYLEGSFTGDGNKQWSECLRYLSAKTVLLSELIPQPKRRLVMVD